MATGAGGAQAAERATLQDAPRWTHLVVNTGRIAWAGAVVVGIARASFALLVACAVIAVFALVTMPIARSIARAERDPAVYGFVIAAFAAKMLGVLARQAVAYGVYNGTLDARTYSDAGARLAPYYRRLDFSPNVGKLSGTGFVKALTGGIYAVIGTSQIGAFVVFSFLSFLGLLLLWRAFRLAVPSADGHRYALLVLFLPSLLYWPSALGKEGWGILGVGMASYGVALVLTKRVLRGLLFMAAGIYAVTLLRPHVALVILGGLVLAATVAKPKSSTPAAPILRVAALGLLFVLGLVLVSQAKSFLGVSSLDQTSIDKKLAETEKQTGEGGSSFTPVSIHSPIDIPLATVTVLFRPLPFDAHSGQELASTAENLFVLWLTWRSRKRLRAIPQIWRTEPYVAYCIGFCAMFIFAFSAISNFGILSRQRTMTMPLFLALLCLPEYRPSWKIEPVNESASRTPIPGTRAKQAKSGGVPAGAPEAATGPYARFADDSDDPYARFRDGRDAAAPRSRGPVEDYDDPYVRFADGPTGPYARFEGNGAVDPYGRFADGCARPYARFAEDRNPYARFGPVPPARADTGPAEDRAEPERPGDQSR